MKARILITLLALASSAHATYFRSLGDITLSGDFTLNHNYSFNNPSAAPFGTFGTMTVQSSSGIFAPFVFDGHTLAMNTQNVNSDPISQPMIWSVGGFTLITQFTEITGADFGRQCFGFVNLTGHGFPDAYPIPKDATLGLPAWGFTAPPYDISNFTKDITGPITMTIDVGYYKLPEGGSTLALLVCALACLGFVKRRLTRHQASVGS